MKTALESLIERLEAGTWRPNEADQPKPKSATRMPARSPLSQARIEYPRPDPAGEAVRGLLKPGEYIDERGVIRKAQWPPNGAAP